MTSTSFRPKQKVSRAAKTPDWYKQSAMYFRDACQAAISEKEAIKLYRLANGELLEDDYLYVTNPINSQRPELQGYPAKMQNSDIISPNLNTLMGEKIKRIFPPIVYAKNTDYQSKALEYEKQLMLQEAQKMFVNELTAQGIPLDKETVTQSLQEIANRIKNLPDELSETGQNALEYIVDYNDLIRHFKKGFYDYICTGMVYSYKDVLHNKTVYQIISPIHISYLSSSNVDFLEDGEAVRAKYNMTFSEVYDKFQHLDDFTEDVKNYVDAYALGQGNTTNNNYSYGTSDMIGLQHQMYQNVFGALPETRYEHGINVEHIVWRSSIKIGKITSTDYFGNKEIFEVSEDYVVTDGEQVEWEWRDEICENYIIDDKYYIGGTALPIQRSEANSRKTAKLPYNGRTYFTRHTTPTSIVKKGESYQKSVNIVKYRAEESLAKNLDKIILFPLGLIPKMPGWNEEKMMYYVRAYSFLFFDDTRPNAAAMVNAMKDLNLSMTEHIIRSYELVRMFKEEWDEVCGINRQRKGDISASAGRGVTQDAQQASYNMSEELFVSYEEFERTEYTGFLELSKYAFSEGIASHYTRMDGQKAFLNIHDPESYINSDLAVFVRNGSRELSKLQMAKAQATNFLQNNGSPRAVVKLIETDNFASIHKAMDEAEATVQANLDKDREVQTQVQASQERIKQAEMDYKYYDTDLQASVDVQVALIQQGASIIDGLKQAEDSGNKELVASQKDMLEQNTLELIKNATKLKEISSKERIAKHKDETMLKNKVSGEK